MVGVIICTHSSLSKGFKAAVEMIMGEQEQFEIIEFNPGDDIFDLSNTIKDAMKNMDSDECIIFTDLFGASPTNAAVIALAEVNACVITGANLGMIMEAFVTRNQTVSLVEFSEQLICSGKDGIKLITQEDILKK